ncbi:MAG: septal ring lytic transglycosylase RlpA family lipoprotein [Acidobacteria bacterium]|nr:MAG: septal ring lytic transglycosylase RlpA family lipoprotein [Acidobacteriota bacterium]
MHTLCRFSIRVALGLLILPVLTPAATAAAQHKVLETQLGQATFYGAAWRGRITASGRKFDDRKAVAAHRTYPFGTVVRVTNLENGRSANVVIIDRGPFGKNRRKGAIIDLSHSVANDLGTIRRGQVDVKLEVLAWGSGRRHREAAVNPPERQALR